MIKRAKKELKKNVGRAKWVYDKVTGARKKVHDTVKKGAKAAVKRLNPIHTIKEKYGEYEEGYNEARKKDNESWERKLGRHNRKADEGMSGRKRKKRNKDQESKKRMKKFQDEV